MSWLFLCFAAQWYWCGKSTDWLGSIVYYSQSILCFSLHPTSVITYIFECLICRIQSKQNFSLICWSHYSCALPFRSQRVSQPPLLHQCTTGNTRIHLSWVLDLIDFGLMICCIFLALWKQAWPLAKLSEINERQSPFLWQWKAKVLNDWKVCL